MRAPPRRLIVLHRDRILTECVDAARKRKLVEVTSVGNWDELFEESRSAAPSTIALVDPYHGEEGRTRPSPDLAALLNRLPSLAVVAAMSVDRGSMEHARQLGSWGVAGILDLEEERTASAVIARADLARGLPLRRLLETSLPPRLTGVARSILGAAARVVTEGGMGEELARAFHITPRTLTRWCRRAGLPPPRRLLGWMRVLLAAELLDDSGRTVMDVAFACGYASDTTLRQALRSFVGETPTRLRETGAFRVAARGFIADIRAARTPGHRFRVARKP